ncbi:hypothetical protein D3C72_2525690 [compost metagenome]
MAIGPATKTEPSRSCRLPSGGSVTKKPRLRYMATAERTQAAYAVMPVILGARK